MYLHHAKPHHYYLSTVPNDYLPRYLGLGIVNLTLPKGDNVILGTDLGVFIKVDEKEVYRNWKPYMTKHM